MNKSLIFVLVMFINNLVNAQDMPLIIAPIPADVEYEFIKTKQIFEENETDLYGFSIGENYFIKITTSGIPDMVIIPYNSYGGAELYRKLENKTYKRVVECRKNGEKCELYLIGENNISKSKIFSVKSENSLEVLLQMGYFMYWLQYRNE